MGYVNVQAAHKKQEAYAIAVAEMANDASATKSELIMKASDEYREYLKWYGYSEVLMEMSRTLRAKGKMSESERSETYGS